MAMAVSSSSCVSSEGLGGRSQNILEDSVCWNMTFMFLNMTRSSSTSQRTYRFCLKPILQCVLSQLEINLMTNISVQVFITLY